MAIYRKGADPVALRASAERISAHARDCGGITQLAATAMNSLKGHWGGGDLEYLLGQWPPIEAQLTQLGTDLGTLSAALHRNAGEQDGASGGGSGLPGVPVVPWGPGAPVPPRTLGPKVLPGSREGNDPSILTGLGIGLTAASLPATLARTAASLSVFSRADGWALSSRYLATISEMTRVGDPMIDLLPGATRFAGGANLFADAWEMKGLSGLFSNGGTASTAIGKFGVLGPLGIGISAASFVASAAHGDVGGMVENGLGTVLAAGAVFAPPPANLVCGVAGLGLAAYQNIPAVHDAVHAVGDAVVDVAEGIGDAAEKAWDTVSGWF